MKLVTPSDIQERIICMLSWCSFIEWSSNALLRRLHIHVANDWVALFQCFCMSDFSGSCMTVAEKFTIIMLLKSLLYGVNNRQALITLRALVRCLTSVMKVWRSTSWNIGKWKDYLETTFDIWFGETIFMIWYGFWDYFCEHCFPAVLLSK